MLEATLIQRQHGMALTEAVIALVATLPLMVLAVSTATFMHDVGVVAPLAEDTLQEQAQPGLLWRPEGESGRAFVPHSILRASLSDLTQRGVDSLRSRALALNRVSAVACYWVHRVNTETGRIGERLSQVCDTRGATSNRLSLDTLVSSRLEELRGIPQRQGGASNGYWDTVVLIGVAVGGEFNGPASFFETELISSGVVDVPRRDVSL